MGTILLGRLMEECKSSFFIYMNVLFKICLSLSNKYSPQLWGKNELWEDLILFCGNGLIVGGFNPFYGNRLIVGGFNPFLWERINCGRLI